MIGDIEYMVKVWIDAGHGGNDSGAVGNGLREKDIVLSIAKEMKRILVNEYGVTVGMTRESDVFLSLSQRAAKANAWGADIFISIHNNAGGGWGFETFRMKGVNDSKTVNLQNAVHDALMSFYGSSIRDRGMKTKDLAVLRETNMAAVLTENLFMDNVEIKKFNDASFIDGVARAHADGVAKYFGMSVKPSAPKQELYRINVGDFDSIEWTAAALTKVKDLLPGYGVWTQCLEGGYHRILVGDFNSKQWADETLEKLKLLGYGMWVQTV
ncbi:N-acetylmuramoyl-L-alanine amidase [Bacillus manliponensis]|uniref:N-acetylmuramoyl-L-alanine amidase family protein n=1 Tax=Bacillus manliponensis TaxID=574376 RepID=UPI003517AC75